MKMREFWAIVELRTKTVSLTSLGLGLILLFKTPQTDISWTAVVLFSMALFLLDMGTTAFNTFFDYWRGTDRRELNFEADKVLLHQGTPPGAAFIIALALFAGAGLLGVGLIWLRGLTMAFFGGLGMLVGFAYSGGRRPLSGSPWGELFAGIFLGGLVINLVYFAGTGFFTWAVLRLSLPSTAMVAALLAVNHACDRVTDQLAGRRTLAVLLGSKAPGAPLVLGALAWGLSFFVLGAGLTLIPLLLLVLGTLIAGTEAYRMGQRGFSPRSKGPQMGAMVRQLTFFTLTYALVLVFQAPASY